jgi:hypothetical protein
MQTAIDSPISPLSSSRCPTFLRWLRLAPLALLICCLAVGGRTFADIDTYTIDGQPVLLYKIIQWWYEAPDAQAPWICGRTLACRTRSPVEISFMPDNRRINLRFETDFADLIWPEIAGGGNVRLDLYPIYTDPAYLNGSAHASGADIGNRPARFSVVGVTPEQAQQWIRSADGLELVLSGLVRGLADDRVALADGPALIKSCPQGTASGSAPRAMTLTLRHRPTDRVLAIFSFRPVGG